MTQCNPSKLSHSEQMAIDLQQSANEAAERAHQQRANEIEQQAIYGEIELAKLDAECLRLFNEQNEMRVKIGNLEHKLEMLARLAAEDWAFTGPQERAVALIIRDEILESVCGLSPNGSRLSAL